MSSLFDSKVYQRRNRTPWARMNLITAMKDLAMNSLGSASVTLSLRCRDDVASSYWWTMEWTRNDGEQYSVSAQELDLCLWRAAEIELREGRKEGGKEPLEVIDNGAECSQCGFRYQAHHGQIIPCPVCRVAALEEGKP